ncbi:MAG: sodium:calcium antiporter, partial [Spirochaetes bacterium]|nr:sodium:calcium antiporter [Spirochaetota bacterium]
MTPTLLLNSVFVLLGLVLLYLGGHFLVSGAAALARKFNVPIIVVGLTVVAFGTSAPELFVSLISAWKGLMSVSVGNVIGSNIINIALILGLT